MADNPNLDKLTAWLANAEASGAQEGDAKRRLVMAITAVATELKLTREAQAGA
ncbi:hypothetical protein PU630_07730 [Microbacterium horticulturae]|uniref:Uncharacterized protein n=1 Tax=Microbacterium horticulturae TaxID=3028316 RepID=A0ABY8C1T7_9MICO|nr:hypothetical protein [Microbacterium sp. KACC 23027]WEG10421.1 hypothetical protein PU630_07730 [Microbacterium sp. KACC 23027]